MWEILTVARDRYIIAVFRVATDDWAEPGEDIRTLRIEYLARHYRWTRDRPDAWLFITYDEAKKVMNEAIRATVQEDRSARQ
ncbi:MAG TPA: hypothetical protein VHT52_17145 [Stellaceae bacterium]|jgi:hypothetical protein|nr:hypothetical protein [Stellaceae bacterium]